MRLDLGSWILLAGCFLAAALQPTRSHGEDPAPALTFRAAAPQADAAPSPSSQLSTSATLLPPAPDSQATTPQPPARVPRPRATTLVFTQPLADPGISNQARRALDYYGSYSARATLSQLPRRAPIRPSASQPARPQAKPFETVHRDPTVSPYLNLYRDENNVESAPNYFAFVRPQMEQLEANRLQQRELRHLRGKLQSMSSTVAGPRYGGGGMPGTGTSARFMDTAQFYGSSSR